MHHWNKAPIDRQQLALFAPTLDAFLSTDHPVRMVDEILRALDLSAWEQEYDQFTGQPPIHPRVLAGVLLYGLSLGIRSSRKLEDACGNRMDFIWLAEGRQLDHSTLCIFRSGHGPQLKGLFRDLVLTAREMGLVRLNQVSWDGTRIKASNSRHHTARHEKLEELKKAMEALKQMEVERGNRKDLCKKGPQMPLADSGFNTGSNLELLEKQQIEGLIPERQSFAENPAKRADPTQPLAEADREKLPVNPQAKVLDKAAFIYVSEQDAYFCPMGKALEFAGTRKYQRENCQGVYRVYQARGCAHCPLKSRCVPAKSKLRNIYRDEYDAVRKRTAERLESEVGKKAYSRRWPVAEGRFGVIKAVLGVRQFLLRGLSKVGMEWTWTAAAYNLKVMVCAQLEKKGEQMVMA